VAGLAKTTGLCAGFAGLVGGAWFALVIVAMIVIAYS